LEVKKKMNIKTTLQIKKQNDYAGKLWIEVTDLDSILNEIKKKIEIIEKEIEMQSERQDLKFREKRETEKVEVSEMKNLSQRISNLAQSNSHKEKK